MTLSRERERFGAFSTRAEAMACRRLTAPARSEQGGPSIPFSYPNAGTGYYHICFVERGFRFSAESTFFLPQVNHHNPRPSQTR